MSAKPAFRRLAWIVFLTASAALLTGCLLAPGKFASRLELRKSGAFSFSYDGEIYVLPLSKAATTGSKGEEEFTPEACHDADTFEDRDCTAEELAQQRQDWAAGAEERKKQKEQEAQSARAMLGGIDPSDPKAAQEFADRLRRQAGWEKVEPKGDGLFEVSFAISGKLDHDFVFPTIEGFPMTNAFVQLVLREGAVARIDAPSFTAQPATNPFQGMMGGMPGLVPENGQDSSGDSAPAAPKLDGIFTVVTDGEILANNTDEGPRTTPQGKVLEWKITPRTSAAPTALIRMAP
jgi:hypothetical protein